MPLKFTNRATGLTILWENEDRTRTMTYVIPKQVPEREQVQALMRAVGFLGLQVGIAPPTAAPTVAAPAATTISTAAAGAAASTSAPQVPMMPPASLSDRPADGGRPSNFEFWESMPTVSVPPQLAGEAQGGWELIPPEEM